MLIFNPSLVSFGARCSAINDWRITNDKLMLFATLLCVLESTTELLNELFRCNEQIPSATCRFKCFAERVSFARPGHECHSSFCPRCSAMKNWRSTKLMVTECSSQHCLVSLKAQPSHTVKSLDAMNSYPLRRDSVFLNVQLTEATKWVLKQLPPTTWFCGFERTVDRGKGI